MHYENEKFVSSTVRIINEVSYNVVSENGKEYSSDGDYLKDFLNVTSNQLSVMVSYIVNFIPYKIYLEQYSHIRNYLQLEIVQHIINLLLQEEIGAGDIRCHMQNIKDLLIFKLMNKTYINQQ